MATCGVLTDRDTRCQRRTDGGRCFMHDSSGPPSSHGAPHGNDNAVGNSGGGAPVLNFNAGTHAGFSDVEKHYQRLWGDAKEWVDELAADYVEVSKANLPQTVIDGKACELATLSHLWRCTTVDTLDRGWVIEDEQTHEPTGQTYSVSRLNPALRAEMAISRRERELFRVLRLAPTPDGRPPE